MLVIKFNMFVYNIMAKTRKYSSRRRRGGKVKNRATKGCGRCRGKRCRHMRGGCDSCRQSGGSGGNGMVDSASNLTHGVSNMFWNTFRGFAGQPPIPAVSF